MRNHHASPPTIDGLHHLGDTCTGLLRFNKDLRVEGKIDDPLMKNDANSLATLILPAAESEPTQYPHCQKVHRI